METSLATLLMVTSAVVIACVVVSYAVSVMEQTLNTQNIPELDRIRNIQNSILNQTDSLFNQTQPELPDQPPP
jgi:hypothetical protein